MRTYGIDVVCLQETRASKADIDDVGGSRVILSGKDAEEKVFTGVGFVVAPWCKKRVTGFSQYSERIAAIN